MEEYIWHINLFVFVLLTVCYLYQFVYVLVVLFKKDNTPQQPAVLHRFGVVIAARNERVVLPNLIRSIQEQSYPRELVDIFVVADNCTDDTAQVAREMGAVVYERCNPQQVGK